jgi:hypothetical protein
LNGGNISVNNGLIAEGGFASDSSIVFTDYRDDFYGGDSNSDSLLTLPVRGSWNNIQFNDQSLDSQCRLNHCVVRYSNYGINAVSASPIITYSSIVKNNYGAYLQAASNPLFHYCDFDDNYYWAINNVNKSFVIDASNCWWGSSLGPIQTNTQGNGTSAQELITTSVNYLPFKTTGTINPAMGDVSLNGVIQAYDASLVLQKSVGLITLTPTQMLVADVSANAGVTSYDASLILQYVVGLIQYFPAELLKSTASVLTDPVLQVGSGNVHGEETVDIPMMVTNSDGMQSADIKLKYNPAYLKIEQVDNLVAGMSFTLRNDSLNGILTLALAGSESLSGDVSLFNIRFRALPYSGNNITLPLTVLNFTANESDLTGTSLSGTIILGDQPTGIQPASGLQGILSSVYPNPSSGKAKIDLRLPKNGQHVLIELYTATGQKLNTLLDESLGLGQYTFLLETADTNLTAGTYFVRVDIDGISGSRMFQVVK